MVIRDAVPDDIPACLEVDHGYETDHVWQMNLRQDDGWQIAFHHQRLPRTLEGVSKPDERQMRLAVAPEHCFLVATERSSGQMLGYLVMTHDVMFKAGQVLNIAVDSDVRRSGIGSRLLSVATGWAKEHQLTRIQAGVQTTNFPAIAFLQVVGFAFCGFNDQYFPNRDIAVFFSQTVR